MNSPETMPKCHGCGAQTHVFLTLENTPLQIERLAKEPSEENRKAQKLVVAECDDCGLLQQISKPSNPSYYESYEQSATISDAMTKYQERLVDELMSDHNLEGQKILEIGAGDGFFAERLQKSGAKVLALEPGKPSVNSIRSRGVPVIHGFFDASALASHGLFDTVVSRQVISHVEPLGSFLDDVAKVVRVGGIVAFECPNILDAMIQGRFVDFLPDYRSYLSIAVLTRLMEARGFKLWSASPRWNGEYFLATFVRFDPALTDFGSAMSELKVTLEADLKNGKRIAVWGAGGRGISLLAQMTLGPDQIAYVIDSSPLKQGKFTPTSGIVVRGPEALKDDPVDTVLVTPVNYAGEIMAALETEYGFSGDIILPFPRMQRIKLG